MKKIFSILSILLFINTCTGLDSKEDKEKIDKKPQLAVEEKVVFQKITDIEMLTVEKNIDFQIFSNLLSAELSRIFGEDIKIDKALGTREDVKNYIYTEYLLRGYKVEEFEGNIDMIISNSLATILKDEISTKLSLPLKNNQFIASFIIPNEHFNIFYIIVALSN